VSSTRSVICASRKIKRITKVFEDQDQRQDPNGKILHGLHGAGTLQRYRHRGHVLETSIAQLWEESATQRASLELRHFNLPSTYACYRMRRVSVTRDGYGAAPDYRIPVTCARTGPTL